MLFKTLSSADFHFLFKLFTFQSRSLRYKMYLHTLLCLIINEIGRISFHDIVIARTLLAMRTLKDAALEQKI
jgi:hypothetical protein